MIEKIVLDYLNLKLDIEAYMEELEEMPLRYVLIEKTGSNEENYVKTATIAIQSFADTLHNAAMLNEDVKEKMKNIAEQNNISRCKLNTDYNYTDVTRKKYRYQAVFDITYY